MMLGSVMTLDWHHLKGLGNCQGRPRTLALALHLVLPSCLEMES